MKQIIRNLALALITVFVSGFISSAQNHPKEKDDWRERMQSEKVAFLTTQMGLSPEESATFWPVYNEYTAKRQNAFKNVIKAYKDIEECIKKEGSDEEISKCLDAYLKATETHNGIESKAYQHYRKILPVEKIAKLCIGEEEFRRHQIHRLRIKDKNQ